MKENLTTPKSRKTKKNKLLTGLLFVLVAVPGAFLSLSCGVGLLAYFTEPRKNSSFMELFLIFPFLAGIFLTLLGLGKLNQWLYGLVFASIPFSIFLYVVANPKGTFGTPLLVVFVTGIAWFIFYKVKSYYEKDIKSPNLKESQ